MEHAGRPGTNASGSRPGDPARGASRAGLSLAGGRRPVVGLVAHDPAVPSFRLRMAALRPALEESGAVVRTVALGRGREWVRVVRRRADLAACDLLVFQQVKLLAGERAFVLRLCPSWVLDVDDAIMFRRPRTRGAPPSTSGWRLRRFRRMARRCRLVVAGSQSLRSMIGPAASRLEVLFTPVDLASYPAAALPARDRVRFAWIGLGSNLCYLEDLAPVLRAMREAGHEFEVRVISDRLPDLAGVPTTLVPWSASTEAAELAGCDVGLAPLADDLWTRGKAAYRCVQYAAAGLPTVASPVGANSEVVADGVTGLWATSPDDWRRALSRLCGDAALRRRMGAAARAAAGRFDIREYGRRYLALIDELMSSR
ncbi:MAG TPA: glycosyltransferase [Thermoanaerobaculaceae bacterium]|nr:glycosyltransferase [Thermoanaerobaculaceae bacterium]